MRVYRKTARLPDTPRSVPDSPAAGRGGKAYKIAVIPHRFPADRRFTSDYNADGEQLKTSGDDLNEGKPTPLPRYAMVEWHTRTGMMICTAIEQVTVAIF